MIYAWLPHETQQMHITVKDALHKCFEPHSKCELYKAWFKSCRKQEEESWTDFSNNLIVVVNKTFPCLLEEGKSSW